MITSNDYVLDESPQRLGELVPTPDHERGDHAALWRRLLRQGYLYLPGLLDPATTRAFRTYYFDALRGTGLWDEALPASRARDTGGAVDQALLRHQLFRTVVPSAKYEQFCRQPALQGWFRWFLEDEVHLHRRKILRHIRPGEQGVGTATQAHYDLVYLREGTDRLLSAWIPLGDCPVELGGLAYLEGSHTRVMAEEAAGVHHRAAWITADLPALANEHRTRWLLADYAAGDVVVHSAHLIHAATDNVAGNGAIRLSTDIRYQRRSDPIDWRWQHHWRPDDGL